MHAALGCDQLDQQINALDLLCPCGQCACSGRGLEQTHGSRRVLVKRNHVIGRSTQRMAQIGDPCVDHAGLLQVGMNRLLNRLHGLVQHATVVAGQQHAPFGQGHEKRLVQFELDRNIQRLAIHGPARSGDVGVQLGQHGVVRRTCELRHFEVGRQSHLQDIGRFVRWPKGLRIRAAQRHQARLEAIPNSRLQIRAGQALRVQARNTRQIRQGRHVHDGHARNPRRGDCLHQFPNAGGAVLRLLHGQTHQVILLGHNLIGRQGIELARGGAGINFHPPFAPLDLYANARALTPNQLRRLAATDQGCIMPGHQKLGGQERAIGRTQNQNLVFFCHIVCLQCERRFRLKN